MLVTKTLPEIQHSHEVVPNILGRAFVSENHRMAWAGRVLKALPVPCSCCGWLSPPRLHCPGCLGKQTSYPQTTWIILSGNNASQNASDFLFPPWKYHTPQTFLQPAAWLEQVLDPLEKKSGVPKRFTSLKNTHICSSVLLSVKPGTLMERKCLWIGCSSIPNSHDTVGQQSPGIPFFYVSSKPCWVCDCWKSGDSSSRALGSCISCPKDFSLGNPGSARSADHCVWSN